VVTFLFGWCQDGKWKRNYSDPSRSETHRDRHNDRHEKAVETLPATKTLKKDGHHETRRARAGIWLTLPRTSAPVHRHESFPPP